MRARQPDRADVVDRQGVKIAYEVVGRGEPALLLIPFAPIAHARTWKGLVPFLSRRNTVVTVDGRGNGRSDRPVDRDAYGAGGDRRRPGRRAGRGGPDPGGCRRPLPRRGVGTATRRRPRGAGVGCRGYRSQRRGRFIARALGRSLGALGGRARRPDRLGTVQPPPLAAELPRLAGVLLRPTATGAALHQAVRGRGLVGPRDRCRDHDRRVGGAGPNDGPGRGRSAVPERSLPPAGDPRLGGPVPAGGERPAPGRADRWRAGDAGGRRPSAPRA